MSVVFAFSVVPIVTTAQEPQAILVKSDSPLVAQKVGQALKNAGVDPRAYRIKVPTAAGALPAAQVTELERRVTATNRDFGKAASDIIVLVKVITKGSQMEELLRNALKDVDKGLYQMEVLKKSGEVEAVLVKSDSPVIAEKATAALKGAGVDPRAYRIKVPSAAGRLPAAQVTELERRVTATNRVFGKAASDIIVLVKVITKGSQMEELLRNALKDVDKGLYQMEVLKKSGEVEAVLVKSDSPVIAEKATAALKGAGVDPRAYRIKVPTAAGTLPAAQVTELERRVTATNRDFGKAASDIIVLVKVITKGSQMEELVRNALKDVDKSLYQIQRVEQ